MSDAITPTSDQFAAYFRSNPLSESEEKMLLLNYFSPNHTITSWNLAAAMGWKNFPAANLHYGGLAGRAAEAMGLVPPNEDYAVSFFVDFYMPESGKDDGHWQWIMWPQLVEAIQKLGWATDAAKEKYESELRWAALMAS
ncbi:hypothetical protein EXS56_00240 [Candidatus Kaiserbacteria bacterium]|nr:hypothetical protein [Candidatus Kaiserbacteria bacterium]